MSYRLAHAEAAANSVLGIVIAQIVLFAFGIAFREALALNAVMIGVSYCRSFFLRIFFAWLADRGRAGSAARTELLS
jgi:hypothetical protein